MGCLENKDAHRLRWAVETTPSYLAQQPDLLFLPRGGGDSPTNRLHTPPIYNTSKKPATHVTGTTSTQSVIGIIPARWASTRFPGKPLHPIAGKPLLQHVWERCQGCSNLSSTVVATDDDRIAQAAENFGARVTMTSPDHPSGTDRIAEAARNVGADFTHAINIQGDEPLIDPALIDQLAKSLLDDPSLPFVTAANPISDPADVADPNVVKVVLRHDGDALYFSRSPIPANPDSRSHTYYRHKGIYGYRCDFLEQFVSWPPSPLEQTERLEQLRALENGARIRVLITSDTSIGVDTPEHVAMVEKLLLAQSA